MPEVENPLSVGVLIVHGIGAQKPGETLAKLGHGLRRVSPELPETLVEGQPVTLGERSLRFYEVYWADLLEGERVSGTFEMDAVSSLAWFPLFNHLYKAYAKEPYPLLKVLWWTFVLPLVGFALFISYWGARVLASLWEAVVSSTQDRSTRSRERDEVAGKPVFERTRFYADQGVAAAKPFERLLDEYAGDVFNYINSAGDTFSPKRNVPAQLRSVYRDILDRFYDQVVRARKDGCQRILIVSHSLGTVVMYHALRGLRLDESSRSDRQAIAEALGSVEHIYTIGSPLEKIRFFWPALRPAQNLAGERAIPWDNFVSYFDPVAGVLRRYGEWGEVKNHRLLGGGFISGHVAYERSAIFLKTFTQDLLGKPVALRRTTGQKIKDWAMLLGETLLAPGGLLVVLVVGTMLWAMVAALLPFLVSLPFRPFVARETWGPIVDYGFLFFAVMFLFLFSILPVMNAKQAIGRLRRDK